MVCEHENMSMGPPKLHEFEISFVCFFPQLFHYNRHGIKGACALHVREESLQNLDQFYLSDRS